jgi:integrase/recombinase XerD
MRISELVSLNVDQLASLLRNTKDSARTYEIPIIGKGKRPRTIFISPHAAQQIRTYLASRADDEKALFISTRSKNRLSARYIQHMIPKYARAAGLAKKVTPHTLRH